MKKNVSAADVSIIHKQLNRHKLLWLCNYVVKFLYMLWLSTFGCQSRAIEFK